MVLTACLLPGAAAQLTVATLSLPAATAGLPYLQILSATGGVGSYTWTVTAGTLPGGLSLSSGGAISGTPSGPGVSNFTLQVSDAQGSKASRALNITVSAALSITTASLPSDVAGSPYQQTLAANGGAGVYSWSIIAGSLPGGLSLSSTGIISGTPTTAGTSSFTVQVADGDGTKATKALSITVAAASLAITTTSLPAAGAGTAYTATLQASGGQPPYSWSVTQGALPVGLSLSVAGAITGTPSGGSSTFTVQVSDAAHATATASLTISVSAPSLPAITIGGFSGTMQSLQQPSVDIALAQAYPLAITGTVGLTFTPAGPHPVDDPAIQFASGGRTATFTIAAGALHAGPLAVQTGSVEGAITLTITSLQAGGVSVPVPAGLSQTVQVNAAAPAIGSIAAVGVAGGVNIQLTGVANTRELTQATVTFQAAAGTALQTTQIVVPLTAVADAWFGSAGAAPYGGQFSMTLPFTFTGAVSLSSVSVVLASAAGSSAAASANY